MPLNRFTSLFLLVFALLYAPSLYGQGAYVPARSVNSNVNGVLRPVAGATITVCAAGNANVPCAPPLAGVLFKDQALTQPLANPTTTDLNGNYPTMALAAGNYTITETAIGFTGFSYQITITCGTGGCTAASLTVTGTTTLNNLTISGTGTTAALNGCQHVNSTQTIAQAITAAASSGCIVTDPVGPYALAANATIPAGVTLYPQGGITTTGFTLTINGPIAANWERSNVQLFFGTGTVTINSGGIINAAWFPGSDMAAQINAAYSACGITSTVTPATGAGGCQIYVPPQSGSGGGCYTVSTALAFTTNLKFVKLMGEPGGATCLNWTNTGNTAVTITAASEAGNTATYTFSSNANCLAAQGSQGTGAVTIAGVTPSGYNGQFQIASNCGAGTSFTAIIPTSGLGAGTIFGTATSTFFAIFLNSGSPITTTNYYRAPSSQIRDFRFSGSGASNPTGFAYAGGSNGCFFCVMSGVDIEAFSVGIQFGTNNDNFQFGDRSLIANTVTPVVFPPGLTGSGGDERFTNSSITNCVTPIGNNILLTGGGPADFHFDNMDVENCQITNANTGTSQAGIQVYMKDGYMEDPGNSGLAAYDYIVQSGSNSNLLSIEGTQFLYDNPTNAHPELINISLGTVSITGASFIKNSGAVQATHFLTLAGGAGTASLLNVGLHIKNSPNSGTLINSTGAANFIDIDPMGGGGGALATITMAAQGANQVKFTAANTNIFHAANNVDFLTADQNGHATAPVSITAGSVACTNGELLLSAGWQSTGTATVTAAAGTGQTCSWTITTGTTTAANPTVTDTLTNTFAAATTVCEMNIHGGTHTPAAGEGFQQTALSATAPIFTFNGTPTAGGTTYFVTRRCGP